jgi:simple sugar transport system ATP-binding protein
MTAAGFPIGANDAAPILQMRHIRKSFPGVRALDGVDFFVRRGEVHALMGENGAGKSTLIKVLTGVYRGDEGEVLLDGKSIDPRSPLDAQHLGISTVYQEVNLVPTLSVAENLFLGRLPTIGGVAVRWGAVRKRSEAALARLDLNIDVSRPLGSYSIAIQQMVAIARALDVSAKLLILDEPTSSLDAGEVERLFAVMQRLRDQGLGIVFVTHFLDQVYAVTDRITVLRNGKLVGEYETKNLPRAELIGRMMGRELAAFEASGQGTGGAGAAGEQKRTLLRVSGFGKRGMIQPFDLEVREGEVVGLAGLLGSGRTEIAKLLFGVERADQGRALVDDRPVALSSPRRAIAERFAFLPEDRKTDGIVPELSVRENIILALQASKGWVAALSRRRQEELAEQYIKALNISTPHAEQSIRNLSGGNQQKALIGRWLASNPRLLILDEPTRGIDVGAKAEIQKLILDLCARGMAVLFISSELEETVRVIDRVAVLRDRQKIAELDGEAISEQAILHTIAGGRREA